MKRSLIVMSVTSVLIFPLISRGVPSMPGYVIESLATPDRPQGITFDSDGMMYVGQNCNSDCSIYKIDPCGSVSLVGNGVLHDPACLLYDPIGIFVCHDAGPVCTTTQGAILIGGEASDRGYIQALFPDQSSCNVFGPMYSPRQPMDLVWDQDFNLLVSDHGNIPASTFVHRANGDKIDGVCESVAPDPWLDTGRAAVMDVDRSNRIWVSTLSGHIEVYAADGTLIESNFAEISPMHDPIALGPGGGWGNDLYMTQAGTIRKYNTDLTAPLPAGAVQLGTGFPTSDLHMEFGPDKALYVSSHNTNHVFKISPDCNGNLIPDQIDIDCNELGGTCAASCGGSDDCNGNGIPDECEIGGSDCNDNGILDECESDCDGDGTIDDCDPDDDNDGILNTEDVCRCTPATVTSVDDEGRPLGDVNGDCCVDLFDYSIIIDNFTGPDCS